MNPGRLAASAALCGTVVLAGAAAGLLDFGSPRIENTGALIGASRATSETASAEPIGAAQAAMPRPETPSAQVAPGSTEAGASVSNVAIVGAALPVPGPVPPPEIPSVRVASGNTDGASVSDVAIVGAASPVPGPMPRPETPSAQVAFGNTADGASVSDVAVAGAALPDPGPMLPPETPSAQVASGNTEDGASVADGAIVGAALPVPGPMPRPETPSAQVASANTEDGASVADGAIAGAAVPAPGPVPPPETPSLQVASANTLDPVQGYTKEAVSSAETPDECLVAETCIDRFLWSVYQRAPKVDTIKVPEQIKVTVKKRGKTRTVSKTIMKLVDEDFTWKDPKAAEKAGMSLMDYVIGGMDRSFKLKLYHALRALDDAGLSPGVTSGFRDNYRQSLASGNKAATDSSYHGGSRRGGYGHGLAADLVSVKGETRAQRCSSSETLWKWIDAHGKEFGVGRPYLDKDPPHVGPIDGQEYADKRGRANTKLAELETKRRHGSALSGDHSRAKRGRTASAKARST